jgi:bilin biosynthesis protein
MSLKCNIGIHTWNGCKCNDCGKTRDDQHDWSKNCEKCSICGKSGDNHLWNDKDCGICVKCGKIDLLRHSWDGEKCKKCGKEMGSALYNSLINKLQGKHTYSDIQWLIENLAKIKYEPAFTVIAGLIKDPDENLRCCVADILGWYDDIRSLEPLLIALSDEDQFVEKYARKSIINLGERSYPRLLDIIEDESCDQKIRGNAISLASIFKDERFYKPICNSLSSGKWYIRMVASRTLAHDFASMEVYFMIAAALKNETNNDLVWDMKSSLNHLAKNLGLSDRYS